MIPQPAALALSERDFQAQVVSLARMQGWGVYHTHDSRRSEPGFPDLICVRPPVLLAIELKTETGKLAEAQRFWLQRIEMCDEIHTYVLRPSDWPRIEQLLRRPR